MTVNKNNKTFILIGLLLGLIFAEMDETVVSTAMPTIIRELHGLSLYGWVAGVYMLAMTIAMPILGRLADVFGRKKIYMSCMALFCLGSIVCGSADSMAQLLIGRGIQGIGAGGLMPIALVIIGESFPLEQRAKVQSLIGPLMILPQLIGPTIGGYFVGNLNWHWLFLINIPVAVIAVAFLFKGLHESKGEEKHTIDWAGAGTLVAALLSFLIAPVLIDNQGLSWSSPIIIGLLVLSAVLIGLFIRIESKAKQPIIPLHLFRNRNVVVLSLLVFTLMLGLMGGIATFPFFAQNVMGLTPTEAGYLMFAFMAGAIPSSIVNGFLITRVAYRNLFITCFVLPLVGIFMLTQLAVSTTPLFVIIAFFVMGLGIGALFGGDNLIVQESVEKKHSGVALGTVQLFQSLGATVGLSVFGSVLAKSIKDGINSLSSGMDPGTVDSIKTGGIPAGLPSDLVLKIQTVFANSFDHIFVIALGFAAVSFIITWFLKKEVLTKHEDAEEQAAGQTVA
ncbi:MDR family MFS transporter [Paenibacillus glycanilyticus]|uniref:MDR family MFS transporter n=1 Tax=Paenibacillus glycanilyticus TaxID=126569 RepID=UPI003EBD2F3C